MMTEAVKQAEIVRQSGQDNFATVASTSSVLVPLNAEIQVLALRMFTNPYLLESQERNDLVRNLREAVRANPEASDLRVVLGMALCVNFEVPDAIEELQEAVRLAPDSFIAQLKLGELWMRLRVCQKAEHHTREAALLARNGVQAELARKQAAAIRTMLRDGIERGGFPSPWSLFAPLRRLWKRKQPAMAMEPMA